MRKELDKLYPPLPALPDEVKALPGPGGRPYTLADFQTIAVLNSPALKQAASAVKSAEGALVQARTYANPTIAYGFQPSNNGETSGVSGIYFDQKINTAGKMALQVAAARQDFLNAELAFKRARSDLATQVRTAYFAFLVAKEAVRVNRGLSILTDEIYRYQAGLLQRGGFAASYEPASLRAQAYMARYQMKTAITSYEMAWAQLVTAVGLRQLPLSEVAGRIDVNIPYFDYDTVKSYVLNKHTDILTARNGIEKARYNLKLARVTPFSDVDFNIYVGKETSLPPYQWYAQGQIGFTLPLWDQNKGNIMSAEGAFVSAKEQPHVAELNLTTNIQNAYTLYKNNLDGLEFYRRYILPDLVRAYRGVLERRRDDPNSQFGDLVAAQQGLATGVTAYLTILGNLWSSAVTVADFLQTDDMFQLANPKAIQEIPDLAKLPCCHPGSWPANGPTAPIDCGPRVPRLPSIFNVVPRHLMSGPSPDGIVLPPAPEGKP
jgi:cobalt-zinc-cadmium efflux system outer membrane protein